MAKDSKNPYSATGPALGYLYQVRLALLESLIRLRENQTFQVSLEILEDIAFEEDGKSIELLQTKHHVNTSANLNDSSTDLWKTIRIWSELAAKGDLYDDTILYLITTESSKKNTVAYYLKSNSDIRDVKKARESLDSVAAISTNAKNKLSYLAYKKLSNELKNKLIESIIIVDKAPSIIDIHEKLKIELFYAVDRNYIDSFVERIEGWWFTRVVAQLHNNESILSEELYEQQSEIREQFKSDNLPIDPDIMNASIDATSYYGNMFVEQLLLINIGSKRILTAIKDYFRAFEHRSRWIREDLLLVGDLDNYENRLIEKWEIYFNIMEEKIGKDATEKAKIEAAQILYEWIETGIHERIRPNVSESSISRGTYHILSDDMQVGWHIEFKKLLKVILNDEIET